MKSVQLNNLVFEIHPFGPAAFSLQPKSTTASQDLLRIGEQLFKQKIKGAHDVISSEKDIVIRFNSKDKALVIQALEQLSSDSSKFKSLQTNSETTIYKFPIYFDEGLDWSLVEKHTLQSKSAIVQQLKASSFKIAMYGFMPGFLYLNGLPETLHCPRKSDPRQNLPAGSIGIGGPYLGCYNLSSPGGWQIIGQTPIVLFDKNKVPPILFSVEDSLKIETIDKNQFEQLQKSKIDLITYNTND